MSAATERCERAVELYRLIWVDEQATDSRRAEHARLIQTMETREVIKYYELIRPLARQLTMTQLLKRAAEETEWTYDEH